jgi:hypothetical protein
LIQALPKVMVCHLKRFNYIQIARKPRVSDSKFSAASKTSPEDNHDAQPADAAMYKFDDEVSPDSSDPFAFEGQPQIRPVSQRLHEPQSGREVSAEMSTNAYFQALAPKLRGGAKPAADDSDSDGPCSRPKGYAQKVAAIKSNKAVSSAGTGKPTQQAAAASSLSEASDIEINDEEAEALLTMDLQSASKFLANRQSKSDDGVAKKSDTKVRDVNPVSPAPSPAVVSQKTSIFLSPTNARSPIVDDDDDFDLRSLKRVPVQSSTEPTDGVGSSASTSANNNEIEFYYTKSQARVRLTPQIDLLPFCSAQRLNLSPTPAQSCSVMTSPRGKGGSRHRSDDESDESQRPKRQKPSPHQVDLTDEIEVEEQSPVRHRIPTLTHVPESPDNSQGMSSQNSSSAIAVAAARGSAWLSTNGKYSSPPPVAPASTLSAGKTTIPLSPVASRPKPMSSPIKKCDKSHLIVDLASAPMEFVKKFIMFYRQPIGAFLTEQNGPNRNQRRARVVDPNDPSSIILDHVEKQHDWEMVRGSDVELRALATALQSMLEMYFAVTAADEAMDDDLELTEDSKPEVKPQLAPKVRPETKSVTDRLNLKKPESTTASTHRKLDLMPVPVEKPAEKSIFKASLAIEKPTEKLISKAPPATSTDKFEKVNAFAPSAAARNTTIRRNTRTAQEEEEAELQEAMRLSLLEEQSRKTERTARDNKYERKNSFHFVLLFSHCDCNLHLQY